MLRQVRKASKDASITYSDRKEEKAARAPGRVNGD